MTSATSKPAILWFEDLGFGDLAIVGGKNASLGEHFSRLGNAA